MSADDLRFILLSQRHHYQKGAVVIVALNLNLKKDEKFVLSGQLAGASADEYLLEAPNGDVSSS